MTEPSKNEIICPHCRSHFFLARTDGKQHPRYCTFCGRHLDPAVSQVSEQELASTRPVISSSTSPSESSIVKGHVPLEEKVQFTIGPYQVLNSIGKGGMGEVFLAYDTICGRRIALKRIRSDLVEHEQLFHRFLKEARITSQLTHPSIIPIYAIHDENKTLYYTMPYVEGETLKEILRRTRQQEKRGEKLDHIGGSIPALVRILISICQAIAYSHSKGVLHRDLKPENIIVGKYGEVLILDWGLAKLIHTVEKPLDTLPQKEAASSKDAEEPFTLFGKVVGTVAYMAPERAIGNPANLQTDIYAIGVILYQMLTLRLPFHRTSISDFRKSMHSEQLTDPAEIAPYREVPKMLVRICQQCLVANPLERYQTVDDLISDLESYIEGRSEWFQATKLDIHKKEDWQFQENVLIAEHVALVRNADVSDWVSLMISKTSFSENIKIDARVCIKEKGHGIGFLLSIPEAEERKHLNDGYCLWLGSDIYKSTKLLRHSVEVLHTQDVYLQRFEWYKIRIEKVDNNIHFFLNDILQFSYISHLPIFGTHVGLLSRDADFEIEDLTIHVGSQNVMVNCLAVPDAFLAHKDYVKALSEYRRIGYSFPGRAEGREAMFRAGVTLLEQARTATNGTRSKEFFDLALQEFEKLHNTPGAPLEYLGKALVYQSQHDYEEEIKCYTLACRRYGHHPLRHVLHEQIVYRMHESSRQNRLAAYNLILLVVRHLPDIASSNHSQKLFSSLQKHWEHLSFIEEDPACQSFETLKRLFFSVQLAFWLAKPYFLAEIIDDLSTLVDPYPITVCNALFCLIELGSWKMADQKLQDFLNARPEEEKGDLEKALEPIRWAIACQQQSLDAAIQLAFANPKTQINKNELRALLYLMEFAISTHQTAAIHEINKRLATVSLSFDERMQIDSTRIWAYLLDKEWIKAGKLLQSYPLEVISKETTPLHFLYGCWLYATEGTDIAHIHFSGILEVSYPRSWMLATHFLNGKIGKDLRWIQKAFMWEKRQLYRQLVLYYHCVGDPLKIAEYQRLEQEEYVAITD